MAFSEGVKRSIFERDGWQCVVCGKGREHGTHLEAHHVMPRGMGGSPEADVEENGMTLCAAHHRKFSGPGTVWEVVRWAPSDPEAGLRLIDGEGRRIPEETLWFYRRHDVKPIRDAIQEIPRLAENARFCMWKIGELFARIKDGAGLVGDVDVYQIGLEAGLPSAVVKRLMRVYRWACELGMDLTDLDPVVADRLRRAPEEDLNDLLVKARALALPDFMRFMSEKYGGDRDKTFRVFTGGYREVRARSEDAVEAGPNAIVVKGGSVIRGIRAETE